MKVDRKYVHAGSSGTVSHPGEWYCMQTDGYINPIMEVGRQLSPPPDFFRAEGGKA